MEGTVTWNRSSGLELDKCGTLRLGSAGRPLLRLDDAVGRRATQASWVPISSAVGCRVQGVGLARRAPPTRDRRLGRAAAVRRSSSVGSASALPGGARSTVPPPWTPVRPAHQDDPDDLARHQAPSWIRFAGESPGLEWSVLRRRSWGIEARRGERCGRTMRLIASIDDPDVARTIPPRR